MAPVFAHANMRDGGPGRLADTYQRELSQGVALERVSVVKDTASALYDWKKLCTTGSRETGSRQCLPGLSSFLSVGVHRLQLDCRRPASPPSDRKVFAAGLAGCEDWMKVSYTVLQLWILTSSSTFSVLSSSSVSESSSTGTHKSYKPSGTMLTVKRHRA